MLRQVALLAFVASAASAGCLVTIDESRLHGSGGSGGAAPGASSAISTGTLASSSSGSGGCPMPPCMTCPQGMALVPTPGGGAYCMDATEASRGDYSAFIAVAKASGLPPECAWKTAFSTLSDVTMNGSAPATGVDWCDAWAYCANHGKRLCGHIGGGSNPFNSDTDPSASEWFNACSKGGTRTFPYGDAYSTSACIGADYDNNPGYQSATDY